MSAVHFIPPEIQENPDGWGPSSIPEQFKDMPYQPFSKGDRIGKVADWTGQTYSDKRLANKYSSQYGNVGGQYSYFQDEDETSFQLVDVGRAGPKTRGRGLRMNNRNMRNRGGRGGNNQMQVLRGGGRGGRGQQQQGRGGRWQRNTGRGRYDNKGQGMKKRDASASVYVKPNWKIIEEMDFPRLTKLSLPGINDAQDLYLAGSVEFYDKTYDRVTTRNEKRLLRVDRLSHKVTTTDDPILRQLSKSSGNVFATDVIISTLMCATRSVISWDIIVERIGDKLFFNKRDECVLDFLTVNETAMDPPFQDEDTKNGINWPTNLGLEATYINHNFSQQVLKKDEARHEFANPNPFIQAEDEAVKPSVAYRYRKFDLGDNVQLVVRTEMDAATIGPSGDTQFMNIKALNEWDPKLSGGIDWRQKLDVQRGAVLANELKNNSCKLARWTVQSLLANSDQLKFGYVSRIHVKDTSKHVILGTQQYKPREFADQINLNMDNAWGILRCIIDTCMRLPSGKYLLLKDPNKAAILLYDVPDNTFESGEEDEDDEDNVPTQDNAEDN
ncbi:Eukaryotic translation initiation factor 3 subunit D [Halotydeus destructor]|nr:Eukaryotic translation initiation factor 3 subunit D [Halotydeus destructor]